MNNITQQFFATAEKFPNRPAIKFKFQGTYISVSFFELARRVKQLAAGLNELGVIKGDRIAILSENRSEWVRSDLATLALGAITVSVHTTLSSKIIKHILQNSGAKVLMISNQEQLNKVKLIADELPELQTIIYFTDGQANGINQKVMSIEQVMELGQNKDLPAVKIEPTDIAALIYTSGTTAMPKGVMLSHQNLLGNATAAVAVIPVSEKDVLLSFLPLSHVLERTAGYYAPMVVRGACIAYAESIKTLSANLKEVKPTILIAVPRIFEKVHKGIWDKVKAGSDKKRKMFLWALKQQHGTWQYKIAEALVFKKIQKSFGGHLRFTVSGGATLNHKLARFFDRIGIIILEGYGLTETSPIISANRLGQISYGTVGQALPGVEIKIAADKEILTKSPFVMQGYWQNQELTSEVIDQGGWLHTGDLGFVSDRGYLMIIGRKKEMISLSNGKIAWPESIEVEINDDRFVSQSFVYGNTKSYLTALIVPDWAEVNRVAAELDLPKAEPGELVKNSKVIELFNQRVEKINEHLADWEKIRKFILLPKEFTATLDELTPTLKLRRKVIEQNYQKELASMYE